MKKFDKIKNIASDIDIICEDIWDATPRYAKVIGLAAAIVISYEIGENHGMQRTDTPLIESKEIRISELINYHTTFVQQLPNYDGMTGFLFGSSIRNGKEITYEEWLIQDLKDNYRKDSYKK